VFLIFSGWNETVLFPPPAPFHEAFSSTWNFDFKELLQMTKKEKKKSPPFPPFLLFCQ